VGELLDVACWFSPYDKEAYLKRLQIQNLMIMVRQKMEALDSIYQKEFSELHSRLANRGIIQASCIIYILMDIISQISISLPWKLPYRSFWRNTDRK
jgi:hypothetical protein